MLKHKIKILLFIPYFFLIGCATNVSEKLGISDLEWESLGQDKQKTLIANYEWIMQEQENEASKKREEQPHSGSYLEVSIYGGKIMFPPAFIDWRNYQPVRFTLFKNGCRKIEITQAADNEIKTALTACFYDNVLSLDASHYDLTKKKGSINIYYSPLWLTGFTYKDINSNGYVRLSNVSVEILQKELSPHDHL